MFEWFFNERLDVWKSATLRFDRFGSVEFWALAVAVAVIAIFLTLARTQRPLPWRKRAVIGVLQSLSVAGVLVAVWQPVLEVETTRPGENSVVWLVDRSRSMNIADVDGSTRREVSDAILADESLVDARTFDIERVRTMPGLPTTEIGDTVVDEGSAIADALLEVLDSVEGRALAAVVLISDGSDNQSELPPSWWQTLSTAGVPVHVVGLGSTRFGDDVELADVQLPPRAARDATIAAQVRLRHAARGGRVRLTVSSGDELLFADDLELDSAANESLHLVRFSSRESGIRELSFQIDNGSVDTNAVNDLQTRVIHIEDQRQRVLYVEGEPRWEYKFIRRALEGDPSVEVVSLLRTSPNKFYRQGVKDAEELADGFPLQREQLFAYDAVIIGSLEAAQLTSAQQAALRDFVSVRGGSLLMLGGRQGLADGGWARSAVAAALPVTLDARLTASTYQRDRLAVRPTRQGLRSGWLALQHQDGSSVDADLDGSIAAWLALPELADHQDIGQVKPGASVLLESLDGDPVYVSQRYGLGTSQVLGSGGSWRWQMRLPADDQQHETFWRTIVSRLADSSLTRLEVTPANAVVRDRDASVITVVARDEAFEPLTSAALNAELVDPDGVSRPVSLMADAARPGRFLAGVPTTPAGVWSLRVSAASTGESPASEPLQTEAFWTSEHGVAEDFQTQQRVSFLRRVTEVTGGSYFDHNTVAALSETLRESNAALTRIERVPLWHMPALFLLILITKLLEWVLRLRWNRL